MERDEHKGLKNLAFIIALIVLFGGVYVMYRYYENPSIESLKNITNLASIPPTTCTVSGGNFNGAVQGIVRIAHGRMSESLKLQVGADSEIMHVVLSDTDNGTMQRWVEGETQGVYSTNLYANGPISVPVHTDNCSPLWNPDPVPFQVPVEITFNPGE